MRVLIHGILIGSSNCHMSFSKNFLRLQTLRGFSDSWSYAPRLRVSAHGTVLSPAGCRAASPWVCDGEPWAIWG